MVGVAVPVDDAVTFHVKVAELPAATLDGVAVGVKVNIPFPLTTGLPSVAVTPPVLVTVMLKTSVSPTVYCQLENVTDCPSEAIVGEAPVALKDAEVMATLAGVGVGDGVGVGVGVGAGVTEVPVPRFIVKVPSKIACTTMRPVAIAHITATTKILRCTLFIFLPGKFFCCLKL